MATDVTAFENSGPQFRRPALTFVDLFAGCGGLSLGFEFAGWSPVLATEISPEARATYMANRSHLRDPVPVVLGETRELLGKFEELTGELAKTNHLKDVDAVVGGPPCQGYSGIGYRRTFRNVSRQEVPSNFLFLEMVAIIKLLRPKVFLFENVRGILTSRWTPAGHKGEIWNEVRTAFTSIKDYYTGFDVLHAKAYGVPQNRPRVFLVGIRRDLGFEPDPEGVASGLLPRPRFRPPDPEELLSDLVDRDYQPGLVTVVYPRDPKNPVQNWFRTHNGVVSRKGDPLFEHEYSNHSPRIVDKFQHMIAHGTIPDEYATKKFAQRVIPRKWGKLGPTITATSLPDDYVHYSQPRSLTVREWARLQTFPDWYRFSGKRTTGGRRRAGDPSSGKWAREVPRYTQIGNAVPVILARAIGEHLRSLIS